MGALALVTAFQLTHSLKSGSDVLEWISHLSFGWFMLLGMTVGLAGYIFSRFYLTFNKHDYNNSTGKPFFRRAAYFINGLGYCLLLYTCIKILIGASSSSDSSIKLMLMQSTVGIIVVGIAAVGLIVSAINEWWISFSDMMNKMTVDDQLTSGQYSALMFIGRVGRFSRGIVFGIFGYILGRSVYYGSKTLPRGADAAFQFMSAQYGAVAMGIVAAGLSFYGLFLILGARHRDIPIQQE